MKKLFTLIELIVVIVVIGILAAIVVPNISSQQKEATISAVKGNIRNLQTSVDMYALKNNGKYPAENLPEYFVPQPVDFGELQPEYTRTIPKTKGFKYWVDAWGVVWGSSVDAPSKVEIDTTEKALIWEEVEGAEYYQVYELSGYEGNEVIGKAGRTRLINPKEITEEKYKGETGKAYVVTAVDEYGFETAPSGVGYLGYKEPDLPNSPPIVVTCNQQGSGTVEDPFIICTEDDFYNIRNNIRAHYKMNSDIVFTKWQEDEGWKPLEGLNGSAFIGTLDGNNHSIKNLYINRPTETGVGLFKTFGSGNIKNLKLENVNVTGDISVGALTGRVITNGQVENIEVTGVIKGTTHIGGITGLMDNSRISKVKVNATISGTGNAIGGIVGDMNQINNHITDSHTSGTFTGGSGVGGIVGTAYETSTISYSSSTASLSSIYNKVGGILGHGGTDIVVSYSHYDGTIVGKRELGGIAGSIFYGKVINSYSKGKISGTSSIGGVVGKNSRSIVSNTYSMSEVNGSSTMVGGVIGELVNYGTVENSYFTGILSGTSDFGVVGSRTDGHIKNSYWNKDIAIVNVTNSTYSRTTSQMKNQSNYTTWDFATIWQMQEGVSYPILR